VCVCVREYECGQNERNQTCATMSPVKDSLPKWRTCSHWEFGRKELKKLKLATKAGVKRTRLRETLYCKEDKDVSLYTSFLLP